MKKLSLMMLLSLLTLTTVEAKKAVTIFLVGDETIADHPLDNELSACGWGQVLPSFLQPGTRVENHGVEGASTKSYVKDGHWAELLSRAKRGNIVFIQFGMHEMFPEDSAHYSPIDVYQVRLTSMISEAKKKGLHVVLFTPVSPCFFKDNVFYHRYGGYPEGVKRVAKRWEIPVVDLETITAGRWDGNGEKEARKLFVANNDTLLNTDGALIVCGMAVRAIQEMPVKYLTKYLKEATEPLYTQPWKEEQAQ